jgi:hypothetical protein
MRRRPARARRTDASETADRRRPDSVDRGGCGGGDDAEGSTLAAVQPCLARLAETTPVRGGVAKGASEAVRLRMPSTAVTVLFASDAEAASALATDYGVFRGARSQLGNIVLAWEAVPDPDDELAVEECIT